MTTEVIDVDIESLQTEKLKISKPRKTDDSLFGKVEYDGVRLHLHLNGIDILKHKKIRHSTKFYTVMQLRVSKETCKKMVDFDSYCIEQVQKHTESWFTKALDENVIEEYYTSSVIINKGAGFLLKLKLQGDGDPLPPHKADIVVALKGLRFYKQRFIPEWEIVRTRAVDSDFLNCAHSDDEPFWEEDLVQENSCPEPDAETLRSIYASIKRTIDQHTQTHIDQRDEAIAALERLSGLAAELEANKNDISGLDRISDTVDKLYPPA